jgi:pentatricopeptide repeat protein
MGNTASLTSAPTPKPLNMRKQYNKYYTLVSNLMNDYNAQLALTSNSNSKEDCDSNNALSTPLPTDKEISSLVRSYRDKYSTKNKPVGIAKALQLLMTEVKVPTSLFGERTYSALIYCAASPKEARRIMQMMEENGIPPGQYAYSILVDIYAKKGDFRGADEAISEMKFESIEPTLAAYTSLLAACYKVIDTASMPQSIKAEAGKLAWERWKELKINDLDPDVMAYGAIIRIMAARGFPEKAINIIEEMQVMDVKPTTLIFTAALKSVARSHSKALMFEGGFSKKNKRRESITAHHGKLTRQIVILAEQAQIKQDEGFTSALMLCAATAGDFATTKAIYLASEVRKLENLRIIGGPEHLRLFYDVHGRQNNELLGIESNFQNLEISDGESQQAEISMAALEENESSEKSNSESHQIQPKNNGRRRKDTRTLSALLRANANAMETGGLGNMWKGIANKGFLCENSLRLINARYQPKYVDQSIPGISGTESGLASMIWDDDEDVHKMGKRLRRKKFMGLLEDTEDNRIEDLDPTLYKLFVEDEDVLFDMKGDFSNDDDKSYEDSFQINGDDLKDHSACKLHTLQSKMGNNDDIPDAEFEDFDFSEDISETKVDKFIGNKDVDESLESRGDIPITVTKGSSKVSSMNESMKPAIIDLNKNEVLAQEEILDESADELDLILYGMPKSRIKKVRQEFKSSLGDPSMLRLVPLLRENLPEEISMHWLREKNVQDAHAVFDKAKEDGVVDIHILNSMLQVHAKAGRIDDALAFYDDQYRLHNIVSSSILHYLQKIFSCLSF